MLSLRRHPPQVTGLPRPSVESRTPGRRDPLLAFAAEALLGAQLVVRHRAPRVALSIAVIVAVLAAVGFAWSPADPSGPIRRASLAIGLAAGVAVVAGARLLAPGPALHAARYSAVSVACAVLGRLAGAAAVLTPPTFGLALLLVPHQLNLTLLTTSLGVVAAALAVSMASTVLVGAMTGSAFWVATALVVGVLPPRGTMSWLGLPLSVTVTALGSAIARWGVARCRARGSL